MKHSILDALDTVSDGVFMVDSNLNFTYMNNTAETFWGKSKENLMGKNIWKEFPYLLHTSFYTEFALSKNKLLDIEDYSPSTGKWYKARINPFEEGYLVYLWEHSKKDLHHINAVHTSERRFRAIFDNSVIGIGLLGFNGFPIEANDALLDNLGYSKEELLSMRFTDYTHPDDIDSNISVIQELIEKKRKSYVIEKRFIRKNGETYWARITSSLVCDSKNNPECIMSIIEDIDDLKQLEVQQQYLMNEWQRLSSLDGLTSLYNRRAFDKFIEEEWNNYEVSNAPLSLALIDIDHFKLYNDTYGHQRGDHCLRMVAEVIDQYCKKRKFYACRYGGEEFAIIMPNTNFYKAKNISESLRRGIENLQIEHGDNYNYITISLGLSSTISSTNISTHEELIQMADRALYTAKESGRNQVRYLIHSIA